jgi:DNA-binding response OmpR family regulator
VINNAHLRILVVDDEPDLRESLTLRFENLGFDVVTAGDGREACDIARAGYPDCIILDLDMPVLDGFGTLKRLRADAMTADIPVIILTASSDTCDKLITRNYGVQGYAIKPYDHQRLAEQVYQACEESVTA